ACAAASNIWPAICVRSMLANRRAPKMSACVPMRLKPVTGATAWRATDLVDDGTWEWRADSAVRAEFRRLADCCAVDEARQTAKQEGYPALGRIIGRLRHA